MTELLRSHDVTTLQPCDHKFVDSPRCLKCGWRPSDQASAMATMLTLWSRLTYEEQRSFLLRVETRATE